jgi:hypothetical protein
VDSLPLTTTFAVADYRSLGTARGPDWPSRAEKQEDTQLLFPDLAVADLEWDEVPRRAACKLLRERVFEGTSVRR